jgi:hypothetical protein
MEGLRQSNDAQANLVGHPGRRVFAGQFGQDDQYQNGGRGIAQPPRFARFVELGKERTLALYVNDQPRGIKVDIPTRRNILLHDLPRLSSICCEPLLWPKKVFCSPLARDSGQPSTRVVKRP